jgi:hypothetical protein
VRRFREQRAKGLLSARNSTPAEDFPPPAG